MRLRREYYSKHSDRNPRDACDGGEEDAEAAESHFIYSSDETICLSLEYAPLKEVKEDESAGNPMDEEAGRRYLRCPAAVTVELLKRLVRGKHGLADGHALDILYGDGSYLCDEYSLVDLAYIYDWRRKGPMRLRYRIYQYVTPCPPPPPVGKAIQNGQTEIEEKKLVKNEETKQEESRSNPPGVKEEKKEEIKKVQQEPPIGKPNGPAVSQQKENNKVNVEPKMKQD